MLQVVVAIVCNHCRGQLALSPEIRRRVIKDSIGDERILSKISMRCPEGIVC